METTTATAIFRKDNLSGIYWLEFDGKPADEIRAALKSNGWSWSGYRKQWRNNSRFAKVPDCVLTQSATPEACDYSSERSERLTSAAEHATERAEQALSRAASIAELRPLGQPILVGHHSEKKARSDQKKIDRAMNKGVEETEKADWLESKAKSSERHQHYKQTNAGLATRRVAKLEADLRKFERNTVYYEPDRYLAYASIYPERTEETRVAALTEHNRKMEIVRAELEQARQLLDDLGGDPATRLNIEPGDMVAIRGRKELVLKVNPKTVTIKSNLYEGHTVKYERSEVTAIVQKAPAGHAEQLKAEAKAKAASEPQFKPGDTVQYRYDLGSGFQTSEVVSVGPKKIKIRRPYGSKYLYGEWLRKDALLIACAMPARVEQVKAEMKKNGPRR